MAKVDRKIAIQECLRGSSSDLSITELISRLDETFKERTVRRLLSERVGEGVVNQSGQGRSTRYQANQQNHSKVAALGFVFSDLI